MIVVLKNSVSPEDEQAVVEEIKKLGYKPHIMHGVARTVIGAIGDELSHGDLDACVVFPTQNTSPIQDLVLTGILTSILIDCAVR